MTSDASSKNDHYGLQHPLLLVASLIAEWPRVNSGAEFERIGRFVWFLVVLEVVVGGIVLVGVGRWIKGKTGTKEWNKKKSA